MTDIAKILSHLPRRKIEELEKVAGRIVDTGQAEIIVLFGSYARGDFKEKRGKTQGKKSDYDILVVTAGEDEDTLLESLKGQFDDIRVHVQVVAEDIEFVNSQIEEGQFFFSDIKREGKVLYTSGRYGLADARETSPTRRREIAEADFGKWYQEATSALKIANFCVSERILGGAAFNFQQVAEMCYTTVEMVFTHYNPHEHHLGILQERAVKLDRRVDNALPRKTREQQHLFNHLNYAYIGGRYRSEEEFPVTGEQLDYWAAETKKLLDITETVCRERIEELKKIEQDG
jgi:uncharacterized protein